MTGIYMDVDAKLARQILDKLDIIMEAINKMTDDNFISLQKEVAALKEARVRQDEALKTRTMIHDWMVHELPKIVLYGGMILWGLYELKKNTGLL